jgi:hypothetical protein
MEIHSLRVKRDEVGKVFPFDRVYLVKHDDRGAIKQLFRSALVMPVDGDIQKMLKALSVDIVVERPNARDDDASAPRAPKVDELAHILSKHDWHLVIPILSKWLRNHEAVVGVKEGRSALPVVDDAGQEAPKYLMSGRWYRGRHSRPRQDKSPLPSSSYLLANGKEIRPICVACPRMIQHQNGECQVGQAVCYDSLSLGMKHHFAEGLAVPQAAHNPKEEQDYDHSRDFV